MATPLWDYPPYPFLQHTLLYCPKAAYLYMKLWEIKNSNSTVIVKKDSINTAFLMSTATFNHNVRLLCREGLISVVDKPKTLSIELVDWDDGNEFE